MVYKVTVFPISLVTCAWATLHKLHGVGGHLGIFSGHSTGVYQEVHARSHQGSVHRLAPRGSMTGCSRIRLDRWIVVRWTQRVGNVHCLNALRSHDIGRKYISPGKLGLAHESCDPHMRRCLWLFILDSWNTLGTELALKIPNTRSFSRISYKLGHALEAQAFHSSGSTWKLRKSGHFNCRPQSISTSFLFQKIWLIPRPAWLRPCRHRRF